MQRLNLGELLGRVDVGNSQVIAFADIRHDGDVAVVESQPLAGGFRREAVSNTAISTLGFINTVRALCGPLQSPLSMRRSPMKIAVGACHADALSSASQNMVNEPRRGGFAVHAGNGGRSECVRRRPPNTTGQRWPRRQGARCRPEGSRCIRKPGAAFTSTMTPPCSFNGREMSCATTSNAGDVQADDLGGVDGAGRDTRMNPLGHVDGGAAGAQVRVCGESRSWAPVGRAPNRECSSDRSGRPWQWRPV